MSLNLEDAWAEAEAALPEGWGILEVTRRDQSHHCCDWDYLEVDWMASAGDIEAALADMGNVQIGAVKAGDGATPAAALRELAAELRETG